MEKPLSVDEFISSCTAEAQTILVGLRQMIRETFPDIEEKIGYGVPQYKSGRTNLGTSVAQKHVTLGFDFGAIPDEIRNQLTERGYKLGLQTLQIKFNQAIPKAEIQSIFNEIKKRRKQQ